MPQSQACFMNTTVTRSQSNIAALRCGRTRDLLQDHEANKSVTTAQCYVVTRTRICEECFQHLDEFRFFSGSLLCIRKKWPLSFDIAENPKHTDMLL